MTSRWTGRTVIETFPRTGAGEAVQPQLAGPPPPPNPPAELVADQAVQLPGPLAVRGIPSTHPETHDKWDGPIVLQPADGLAAGTRLIDSHSLAFSAKSAIIDNLTNYVLRLDGAQRIIAAGAVGVILPLFPALTVYSLTVISGNNTIAGGLYVTLTERVIPPATSIIPQAAGGGTSTTIVAPLDGAGGVKVGLDGPLPAGSAVELLDGGGVNKATIDASGLLHAFIASGQITIFGSTAAALLQNAANQLVTDERAAPNWATAQIATSTVAGTLAIARATRQRIVVRNLDAAISVWVGPTTVTSANGVLLKAGESRTFYTQTLLQVIAASGTPSVEIDDYWT